MNEPRLRPADEQPSLHDLRRRLLDNPRDARALRQAGELLYRAGDYPQACTHLRKAVACHQAPPAGEPDASPDPVQDALKRLGDCCAAMADGARAERYYRAAAEIDPREACPHLALGLLALHDGRDDDALGHYRRARRLRPDCPEACSALAALYQKRADYPAAFEMYLRCLQIDGDDMVALLGLFQVSRQMGSFEKIIHYLEVYLRRQPGDSAVLFCLATLYAREGRLDDARQAALELLAVEPDKPQAVELLAELDAAAGGQTAGAAARPGAAR
jgi:tetratricopeptide (TPR) repeat protein